MNKNEQVAIALRWTNSVGCSKGCGEWYEPIGMPGDEVHGHRKADLPDYEHDIAAALTLIPLFDGPVTLEYDPAGIPDMGEPYWAVRREGASWSQCADTLSAAIVDAFLATKGG